MPQLNPRELQQAIITLEQRRDSRVLVLAASHLEMELLPALYEQCQAIGPTPRLDVLLHGRGGVVNAARRIGLLLRAQTPHLGFIVPYHCQSAATLLSLCGDEIVTGDLALFSPIDPQLNGEDGGSFSGLDIELFGDMAKHWFGLDSEEARAQSLALLCNSVFPPSLTAFYRTTREMAEVAQELLAFQLKSATPQQQQRIVHQLMSGYHSHNYALTGVELEKLGLRIRRDRAAEQAGWEISKHIQATVGGGLRDSEEAPWFDAMLATRDGIALRRKQPGGLAPSWSIDTFTP